MVLIYASVGEANVLAAYMYVSIIDMSVNVTFYKSITDYSWALESSSKFLCYIKNTYNKKDIGFKICFKMNHVIM